MSKMTLTDFVARMGQAEAARIFGVSPAAIKKAVDSGRSIFVKSIRGGGYEAEELRPFPSQNPKKAA